MRMGDQMVSIFSFGMILFWLMIAALVVLSIIRLSRGSTNETYKIEEVVQVQRESLRRQEELAEELKEVKAQLTEIENLLKK